MERIFTYGTLQDPAVQRRVFGRLADMQDDTLQDYKKERVQINYNYYFIAVQRTASRISGKVFEVTQKELRLLDAYETNTYRRVSVTLQSGLTAWVYCR